MTSLRTRSDIHLNNDVLLDITSGNLGMRQTGGFWIQNSAGTIGRLTSSSGTLNINSVDANWVTSTGKLSTADHQIQGFIVDPAAGSPLAVVKNGVNQVTLTRANTYTGGTTINAGRINAGNAAALGTAAVTVNAGGQAYLTAANTVYTNPFTLAGNGPTEGSPDANYGALRLGNNTVSGNITIAAGGARIGAYGGTGTLTGAIIGNAPLQINSPDAGLNGAITVSGDTSEYTGTLTVSQGSLTLNSNLAGSVAVGTGATLAVNGSVAGDYTHTTGTLQGTGTFKGNLTLNGATTADVVNIVPGALQVDGDLTLAGSTTIRASGMGGVVPVLTYSGTLTGDETNLALENAAAFRAGTAFDTSTPGVVNLVIVGVPLTWNNGAGTRIWSTATADTNWSDGTAQSFFYQSDGVSFTDTGAGLVTLSGVLSPGSITINNSLGNDYIFDGGTTGMIGGLTGIYKTGTGNLTLGGINGQNYAGPVAIDGGLVTLATRDALGKASSVTIAAGAQLDLNGQTPGTVLNGAYAFTVAGTGLDGVGGVGALGSSSPTDVYGNSGIKSLTLSGNAEIGSNGGRFDIGLHVATGTNGTITGNGHTLTKVGGNILNMRAPATDIHYVVESGELFFENFDEASGTHPITVNGGILASYGTRTFPNDLSFAPATTLQNNGGGTGTWNGNVTFGGTDADTVTLDCASADIVLNGTLAGAPNLTVIGGSWLTLGNTNNSGFTGRWDVNGGNLLPAADASLGAVPAAPVADAITLRDTGWLGVAAGVTELELHANRGIALPVTSGSLVPNTGQTLIVNGPISGTANLLKEYPGTAVLTGGSTHTGVTRITGGKLVFESGTYTDMTNLSVAANMDVKPGANITATTRFLTSDASGGVSVINQTGGSINILGNNFADSNQNSVLLAHWGAKTTYEMSGGSLNVPNVPVIFGWDGILEWNVTGGTINIMGLAGQARANAAVLNLNTGARLNIGSYGINNIAAAKTININGGTLGASADWSSNKAINFTGSSTVDTLDAADGTTARTISLNAALTGDGSIVKQGPGTLVIANNASTLSGGLQVTAGKLHANLATTSSLKVSGTGTLSPGTPSTPAAITTGSLELAGGTTAFRIGATADAITSPAFNITAPTTITITPASPVQAPASFTLVDYEGSISGLGKDGLTLALPNPHYAGNLEDDTTLTALKVNITAADAVVWRGSTDANWNTETENWVLSSDGTTPTKFYAYDVVKLDDTGLGKSVVTLVGDIQPASVVVDNTTGTYTLQGAPIAGASTLTKANGGALVLANDNTYLGATTLTGGSLTVGTGGTTGTLGGTGNVTTAAGTRLAYNRSDLVTLNRVVTGEGILAQDGSGTLAIPVRQTHTGGTVVTAGIMDLTAGGGQGGTVSGTVTVNTGAILRLSTGDATGWGGGTDAVKTINLNGGAMDINTTANQTLGSAVVNLTGGAITGIAGANLDFFGGGSALNASASAVKSTISGTRLTLRQAQGVTFTVEKGSTPDGIDLEIASLVTNAGYGANPLTKAGTGTLKLTSANDYSGNTLITGGTLDLSGTGGIYTTAAKGNANSLVITGGGVLVGDRWGWGATESLGQLNYNSGYIAVDNGTIRNVAANSTYMGGDTNSRGINIGSGGLTIENATPSTTWTWVASANTHTYADNATLTLAGAGDGSFAQTVSGNGVNLTKSGAGTWTITAPATHTGNTTVNEGTLVIAESSGLTFAPTTNGVSNKLTGPGTVTINGDFTLNLAGATVAHGNQWTLVDATNRTFSDSFSVTGFTEASNVWTKTDGLATWTFSEATGILKVTMPGYDGWLAGFTALPQDQRGPSDDFDRDGFSNLLEYVLGGSPLTADSGVIRPSATRDASGNLVFTFRRSDLSEIDTTLVVQYGSDLSGWTEAPVGASPGAGIVAIVEDSPTAEFDTVTVTIPATGQAKTFARLKVVKP